jgi:tetratricopeptide (TPR) repeat protein
MSHKTTAISDKLLIALRRNLADRRIRQGIRLLDAKRRLLESLDPASDNAAILTGLAAQWVDLGFADLSLLKRMIGQFSQGHRSALSLMAYVHLRFAEGMLAMSEERYAEAIAHLQFVITLEKDIEDQSLGAISSFWIGRCYRKTGQYEIALEHTQHAIHVAMKAGYKRMAAVMRLLESWLAFQMGHRDQARSILASAERALAGTDDFLSKGNIYSARGRIARREGRYERALEDFGRALEMYEEAGGKHRNAARALTNIASVKRLMAHQIASRIDADVAGQRPSGQQMRKRLEELRKEVLAQLGVAEDLYRQHDQHHGLGNVALIRSLLRLDCGEFDRAEADAALAFRAGEEKNDFILMARARIVDCMIENAKFEEQVEEYDDPSRHAQRAYDAAAEAVEFAGKTQSRRLKARAQIWKGLTLANGYFNDVDGARECCDSARSLLEAGEHDYVWKDYQILRRHLLRSGSTDARLREWTQGRVGDKTFQEITEDFAAIVIPEVWKREGAKVSRVARVLSMSPKKVRRILAKAQRGSR